MQPQPHCKHAIITKYDKRGCSAQGSCALGRKRCAAGCKDFEPTEKARLTLIKNGYTEYETEDEKRAHEKTFNPTIIKKAGFSKFRDENGVLHKIENGHEYTWNKNGRFWNHIGVFNE